MPRYTEVYGPSPQPPAHVFYTITGADVGKRFIKTEAGTISLADVIGYVQPGDVGKRLYRVPTDDGTSHVWQCESGAQRDGRLSR